MRSPLGPEIAEADRALIKLSDQQYALLDLMRRCPRVEVSGCAGAGKTLLAARKAQLLAEQGFATLLTCFNSRLADYLRRSLEGVDGLEVRSFHQLCRRRARQAEIPLDWPLEQNGAFFEETMPDALRRSADKLGPALDAIVIDEGQDFAQSWWGPLLGLLHDPEGSVLYVFYDDNQALYTRPRGLPEGLVPFTLNQNWRNTRRINALVEEFYRGEPILCMGPEGIVVELRLADSAQGLRDEVRRVLERLVRVEEVATNDIVVLTPHAVATSGLLGPLGGGFHILEEPYGQDTVRLSSVHHFKGFESRVVVLAGVPRGDGSRPELMYVGCSRARAHLVVIESS